MNILMALSQLEVTGAEVYATTVGDALTARGHRVFYVSDTLTKPHQGEFFMLRFNKRSIPRRFWHVCYLVYLIKKHRIQLVHAHSRASSWSCYIACKLTGTPMLTTVHGRQPVHASRKNFHALGDRALAVCEAVREQLVTGLRVSPELIAIGRNGIDTEHYQPMPAPDNHKPVISIIGRLTGPKGELCYRLLDQCLDLECYRVKIASGSQVPERFQRFQDKVEFLGYVQDVPELMAHSDLVIGAGRVAMEAILMQRPVFAVGEAEAVGLVTTENIDAAMASNFGDIGPNDLDIDFAALPVRITDALNTCFNNATLAGTVRAAYDLQAVTDELEHHYQSVIVHRLRREIPIIMYHRFIRDDSEKGVHGTYLHVNMLEKHFKLLKRLGYETLTFAELADRGMASRLEAGKKYIIITVDDGYKDNFELLFPLLKKYGFKAVIYAVTGETFNRWDVENPENPEKTVELMTPAQIKEMANSGLVEFGGHTLTHPKLDQLGREQQRIEIAENKTQLEQLLGHKLTSFAYPFGIHNEDSKQLAKELGYPFAVATNSGPLAMHEDRYQIRRIAIFPRTDVFGLWRKIKGNYVFRKN
ncbi:polysaccharide deacetylase family protein [Oceanimonas baumannii]|uniref:Peptidoglycan/xylan/chitin deacetylase (PgdA/CDA1 family) n=1 Tax=Oceanimonas baumannii TaxID=129578 RepID=A0A235CKI6_9GAMM|nr:polysaccharide deacetylase family protein [Oceanimonas baumannii]OYD24365.1 polysaccharide deacetylase [Oceanimonas baumannii]TDW59104.1 peptidoglycan/xylan/chitin deacetylase (PgdA/CDA1 family) [Oceanimonas baumannii]